MKAIDPQVRLDLLAADLEDRVVILARRVPVTALADFLEG